MLYIAQKHSKTTHLLTVDLLFTTHCTLNYTTIFHEYQLLLLIQLI